MIADENINISELSERLDGDINFFRELADIFFRDYPGMLDHIQDAIDAGDAEKIRKTAHTLKGAVANFSAERAVAAAYDLEQIGAKGELDKTGDAFSTLKKEIESTVSAMETIKSKDSL